MKHLPFQTIKFKDGFWKFYADLNRNAVVRSVYERFKETGRFDALRCDWREGLPNKPHIFWDSDVAKWIEGVAYIIYDAPAPEWETIVDEMIGQIAKNQREDGYFNSYYLTVDPSRIFTVRDNHELYCLGHMIEAAIAYHQATGKDQLLNCVLKNIDCVYRCFVEEKTASFVTPGHQEIEIALLKLYAYLGNEKHLTLARFFLDQRGNNDQDPDLWGNVQDDVPVRKISEAKGHAVRAGYLYTAMQMLASVDRDAALQAACDRVFDDIVNTKLSVTGGVGDDHEGERFSHAYDLQNSVTYNETCASIALMLFAHAKQAESPDSRCGDVIERVLYNGLLSSTSLDGTSFFYNNPLEIDRKKYGRSGWRPICQRVGVFDVSCCPPNVVRTIASIARYFYSVDGDTVYCNQFASSETNLQIGGKDALLKQTTNYPLDGKITFEYHGEPMTLCVRIPEWCVEYRGETQNGFAKFELSDGECVVVDLPMEIHFVEANPYVQENSGRYAVQRGPI
ncbi:MAG: glycoside hydrolase family 127 protein, partial [Oscillospiraceae bacterium]|nr:glycoside hydrolase family 127 protein [Oscillospiraceae bacterium]